jgi:hypothetical protein
MTLDDIRLSGVERDRLAQANEIYIQKERSSND